METAWPVAILAAVLGHGIVLTVYSGLNRLHPLAGMTGKAGLAARLGEHRLSLDPLGPYR